MLEVGSELEKGLLSHEKGEKIVPLVRHEYPLWRPPLAACLIVAMLVYAIFSIDIISLPTNCNHTDHTAVSLLKETPLDTIPVRTNSTKKVALEAHIMSKCPDARDCLRDLVVPAMANISDQVDFTLSYIGRIDSPSSSSPITCKHGPSECMGNILELCAASLYPSSPKIYLGFTLCLSADYAHIPQRELVKECALEHAVDFAKLKECASREGGEGGMELLRGSVKRSAKAGVGISCTVRLGGKEWCVRDGGEWKGCTRGHGVDDLVRDVKKAVETGY